jgi:hypothetical protein
VIHRRARALRSLCLSPEVTAAEPRWHGWRRDDGGAGGDDVRMMMEAEARERDGVGGNSGTNTGESIGVAHL